MSEMIERVAETLAECAMEPFDELSRPKYMGDARAAIEAMMGIMTRATVSSSGLDITITCDDHDTKDAIFDVVTGQDTDHDPQA